MSSFDLVTGADDFIKWDEKGGQDVESNDKTSIRSSSGMCLSSSKLLRGSVERFPREVEDKMYARQRHCTTHL